MEVVGRPLGTERPPNTPSRRAAGARAFELGSQGPDRRDPEAHVRSEPARSAAGSDARSGATRAEAHTDARAKARAERAARASDERPGDPDASRDPGEEGEPQLLATSAEAEGTLLDPVRGPHASAAARLALPHTGSGPETPAGEPTSPVQAPHATTTLAAPGSTTAADAAAGIAGPAGPAGIDPTGLATSEEGGAPGSGSAGEARPLEVAAQSRAETSAEPLRAAAPAPTPARPSAEAQARAADILHQVKVGIVPELGQATIRLAPRELGRISISLTLEQGRARATLRAERPETLEALTRHVPELRAAFEQRGIEPGDIRLELLDRRASDGRADHGHEHGRNDGRRGSSAAPTAELDVTRAALARTLSDEAVDLYA